MIYRMFNAFHNTEVAVRLPKNFVQTRHDQREVFEGIEFAAKVMQSPLYVRKLARIRRTLCPSGGYPKCMCGIVRNERND